MNERIEQSLFEEEEIVKYMLELKRRIVPLMIEHLHFSDHCFRGSDGVRNIMEMLNIDSVEHAILFGNILMEKKYVFHVTHESSFTDSNEVMFRFNPNWKTAQIRNKWILLSKKSEFTPEVLVENDIKSHTKPFHKSTATVSSTSMATGLRRKNNDNISQFNASNKNISLSRIAELTSTGTNITILCENIDTDSSVVTKSMDTDVSLSNENIETNSFVSNSNINIRTTALNENIVADSNITTKSIDTGSGVSTENIEIEPVAETSNIDINAATSSENIDPDSSTSSKNIDIELFTVSDENREVECDASSKNIDIDTTILYENLEADSTEETKTMHIETTISNDSEQTNFLAATNNVSIAAIASDQNIEVDSIKAIKSIDIAYATISSENIEVDTAVSIKNVGLDSTKLNNNIDIGSATSNRGIDIEFAPITSENMGQQFDSSIKSMNTDKITLEDNIEANFVGTETLDMGVIMPAEDISKPTVSIINVDPIIQNNNIELDSDISNENVDFTTIIENKDVDIDELTQSLFTNFYAANLDIDVESDRTITSIDTNLDILIENISMDYDVPISDMDTKSVIPNNDEDIYSYKARDNIDAGSATTTKGIDIDSGLSSSTDINSASLNINLSIDATPVKSIDRDAATTSKSIDVELQEYLRELLNLQNEFLSKRKKPIEQIGRKIDFSFDNIATRRRKRSNALIVNKVPSRGHLPESRSELEVPSPKTAQPSISLENKIKKLTRHLNKTSTSSENPSPLQETKQDSNTSSKSIETSSAFKESVEKSINNFVNIERKRSIGSGCSTPAKVTSTTSLQDRPNRLKRYSVQSVSSLRTTSILHNLFSKWSDESSFREDMNVDNDIQAQRQRYTVTHTKGNSSSQAQTIYEYKQKTKPLKQSPVTRPYRRKDTLNKVLHSNVLRERFKEFANKELSDENIIFWEEVEHYRMLAEKEDRKRYGAGLYKLFVCSSSPLAINFSAKITDMLAKTYDNGEDDTFDMAQIAVEILMSDTFKRFKMTTIYRNLISESTISNDQSRSNTP
jgi:tRNA splicing endonuclease